MTLAEDREAVERAWLALVLAPGVGSRTLARLASPGPRAGAPMVAVPGAEIDWLRSTFGLTGRLAAAIQGASAHAAPVRALAEALRSRGVRLLTLGDAEYPSRVRTALGGGAPPLLYLEGEAALLRRQCAALFASRRPAPEVLGAARAWAERLRERGLLVVRGESTPFDRAAAAEADITVLSTGILAKARRTAGEGPGGLRVGFVHPHWGFKGSVERERNGVQAALADVCLVLEARPGGIVEQTAHRALAWGRPVLVRSDARGPQAEGAQRLLAAGARPLDEDRLAALPRSGADGQGAASGERASGDHRKGAGP